LGQLLHWRQSVYAAKGRISKIYLLDAAVELLIIRRWLRNT
jgi:hypothetical protein